MGMPADAPSRRVLDRVLAVASPIAAVLFAVALLLPMIDLDASGLTYAARVPRDARTSSVATMTMAKLGPLPAAEGTVPPLVAFTPRQETPPAWPLDIDLIMGHVRALAADIGVRGAGSEGERQAAAYISEELTGLGYAVTTQEVPLPEDKMTRNVIATRVGTGEGILVLGAHYDTKPPSPGANDNASGVAVLLDLARVLKSQATSRSIVFAFFGAEEIAGEEPDEHHFGSRKYVEFLTESQLADVSGMISVDMVGYGPSFHVRTMGKGPASLQQALLSFARAEGFPLTYKKDTSATGSSDHEAFELAGVPAAWLQWRDDPDYHTTGDTPSHLDTRRIETTAAFLYGYITRGQGP
jgi:hypothetical protein